MLIGTSKIFSVTSAALSRFRLGLEKRAREARRFLSLKDLH